MAKAKILLLPGDGIGPEVVAEAVRILDKVAALGGHSFEFEERLVGGSSIDRHGIPVTEAVLADCKGSHAVLLGAVGGPKWDDPQASVRPEQGLLALRKGLEVFANLRPVKVRPVLLDTSPLRPEKLAGVDILVVRELTGGLYFGTPKERVVDSEGRERAVDTLEYHDYEIRRIVRLAFRLAQNRKRKVTSVDKANILETSRLWRSIAAATASEFPGTILENMLVDTASMRLVTNPASFDVVVTDNMFGDILTDEASILAGSMGMLPSASIGDIGPGLYEPIHGSAPDIAGKGIANPVGTILSAAMLLRYSLQLEKEAGWVESAVDRALDAGARTADLVAPGGKPLSTREMTDRILGKLISG
jgi:3-isopropylmalate dehydrogenase